METRVPIRYGLKPNAVFPHPNDALDKIWLRSAHWSQIYSCLKMWTHRLAHRLTDDCSIYTSSQKGNDRSPDNKLSKYVEQFSSKRFINWSRAANSAVHGLIRPNFKLFRDYIVALVTCMNEEDPTNMQN